MSVSVYEHCAVETRTAGEALPDEGKIFDLCNTSSFSAQKMFSMQSGILHTGIVWEELSLVQMDLFSCSCLSSRQPELGYMFSFLGVTYVEVCAVSCPVAMGCVSFMVLGLLFGVL